MTGVRAPLALTTADYARAERFMPYNTEPLVLHSVGEPAWLPTGRFWYRTRKARGFALVLIDAESNTRRTVFDQSRLSRALASISEDPRAAGDLQFDSLQLSHDECSVFFELGSTRWKCALDGSNCALADIEPADLVLSPDGACGVFVRDHNLWLRVSVNGRETQLTHDGMPGFAYATNNSGRQRSARPCVLWSPDSKRIASFQQDERGVGDMYLVRAQRGHPTLETWKYPMPCDATIPTIHRVIIDVEALRVVRLDMPADYVRSASWLGVASDQTGELEAQWSPDGASLAFVSVSRDHKRAQLRIADALTGAVRDVLEEHASTFYEAAISAWHASRATRHPNWVCLLGSEEVIWYSARSNWSHLYLYELATGKLKRAITSGNWNVVTLLHVDQQARMIYFLAVGRESGRNPYFEHLYRVGLDGGEPVLLTDEDATHAVSMAPSGEYFVDSFSRPEMPPVAVLRDRTGRLLRTLERADISRLTSIGWKPPATITVKARDQRTNLFGLMFKPSHLDENRKYPIVNAIYSGAILGSVISWGHTARRWGAFAPAHGLTGDAQSLAELGFIVVMIDGMGTPLRSRAFHEAAYGNYGDGSLADQVTGMQQLAQRYPFIDIDRAGIYGLSGGGYRAARGMLTYPDFFNVGVAIAGNHDPMSYQDEYAEKFIGLCSQGPGGSSNYDMQANMALARNLTGRLLLAHGMMDDNVPPYHTLLLAEALIEANKDFDLLLLPSQGHAIAAGEQGRYLLRRCWDHFVRHLLGAEPPREYRMSAPSGANTTRYQRSAFGDVGLVRVRS